VPVWLAVTVDDDDGARLRSGEAVADIVPIALAEGAEAVLANCSVPESMPAALGALAPAGLPMGAYANAFTRISDAFRRDKAAVDSLQAREDLGPDAYGDHVMAWVAQGARIVGGCCETGPEHIAAIAHRLALREVA
jgi:homocysteine S-methyltransferase